MALSSSTIKSNEGLLGLQPRALGSKLDFFLFPWKLFLSNESRAEVSDEFEGECEGTCTENRGKGNSAGLLPPRVLVLPAGITTTRLHPARSRLYAFPMHFPTAFGPSQAVSFALECNSRGFFSSGFVLKHPYIHANAFTCRNPKKVSLWNSYISERASGVHH